MDENVLDNESTVTSDIVLDRKVYIRTFGCQMNDRDSEIIAGLLKEKGYSFTENPDEADFVFFNTCSVRQHAEERVIGNIKRYGAIKKNKPNLRIGVLGCMAKRYGESLLNDYPEVDIVVGPGNIFDLADVMDRVFDSERIVLVDREKRPLRKDNPEHRTGIFSSYVNIMYGCDNYCSYCIVPFVRGREMSRPKRDILSEIRSLAERGFKEIVLLGQNVNSYGRGLTNKITFAGLLEEINAIEGIERIRFTTSHPRDAEKDLFRAIKDLDKVCENLHLPLQSASNRILDIMNRGYTYEDYKDKVAHLRELVAGVSLSTDIIVGFPSEKNYDFEITKEALEKIRFNSAFIFKYSPRPPALSSTFVDDVTEEDKKGRHKILMDIQKNVSYEKNKELIGSIQQVLAEGKSKMSDDELIGRTRNNTPCVFPSKEELVGRIVHVYIKDTSPTTLKGELMNEV